MGRYLQRLRARFRRERQLGLLFGLLLCATVVVSVVWLTDLWRLFGQSGGWRALLDAKAFLTDSVLPLLRSKLFQLFVLLAGWSFWVGVKKRQLDQIRLRRSEHKYRNIINHAGEAIFLLDGDGCVLEWNKAAEKLFSEPRRNVLGRPFRDIHLCYGLRIDQAMADAENLGRSLQFEFPFPRPGRPGGLISLVISAISTGLEGTTQLGRAFVVIARDITSQRQLESKMSETEKLAGIGQLAAGIAHQLNTPLGSILLSAQMLEETVQDEDQQEDIRRIIRQTDQCRTIIKGLLNFARPSGKERGRLHLGEVIRETVYLLEKNIKLAGVEVQVHEKNEPVIHGNRNEIDQVFFNLLTNALDAMPKGGEVLVTLGDGAPGEVLVEFADQGEGISPDKRDQVFLPFFSTKEYGKGTGLGLSIVARIVHEHGGRISMDSQEGRGTTFYLSFPKPGFGLQQAQGELVRQQSPDDHTSSQDGQEQS
jgi:PAS domain S-box-containing protein